MPYREDRGLQNRLGIVPCEFNPFPEGNYAPDPTDYLVTKGYWQATTEVPRFQDPDYPEGMITDTLRNHLLRSIDLIRQMNLPTELLQRVERIILIHDLPEVATGDTPAVMKQELGIDRVQDETEAASVMLTDLVDIQLYEDFESARVFLKSGDSVQLPSAAALIARLTEQIESNMFFHQNLHDWLKAGNTKIPRERAIKWTFVQAHDYQIAIEQVEDGELRQLLLDVLNFEIDWVKNLWQIDDTPVPQAVAENL